MTDKPESDAGFAAIVAGLRGDATARRRVIDELYQTYGCRVRSFMEHAATPAEAEELMHEVFIRVMRSGATFKGEPRQFPAWFWTIARRLRCDHCGPSVLEHDEAAIVAVPDHCPLRDPEQCWVANALHECLTKGFDQFKAAHPARALALSWLVTDGMTLPEIAQLLQRKHHAAIEYLSQCRKKLAPFLQPCRELYEA